MRSRTIDNPNDTRANIGNTYRCKQANHSWLKSSSHYVTIYTKFISK